jgi:sarcosine oxidase subunit gamma
MPEARLARSAPTLPVPAHSGSVSLEAVGPATRFSFRGDVQAARLAGEAFGLPLPVVAGRVEEREGRAALWLGPDEWLLLAPDDEGEAIATRVAAALGATAHALVDISHRNGALEIAGPKAADVLAAFVPLDLDPPAFPIATSTRTVLARAEITLWRRGPERFRLEAVRSFLSYIAGHLEEARREFRDR